MTLNFSCRHSPRVWLLNVVIACIVSFVSLSVVLLHKSHVYVFGIMIMIIIEIMAFMMTMMVVVVVT
mgnify:CR=1 FL=1